MTVNSQIHTYEPIAQSDAELFVNYHFDRFKSWLLWAAPGGMAHINLASNDAAYDKFVPPEIAVMLDRVTLNHELTFLNIADSRCLCLMDAIKVIELMEAANG